MSTPQIPNLNTLRRGNLRSRGRGGATLLGSGRKSQDEIIQATDNDAASSRLSAIDAGYLDDPFAKLLTTVSVQQRLPLMNRGSYVRTIGLDKIVDTFLVSQSGRKQIISLGAGSDTRFFRLQRKYTGLDLIYHEIDFEANTRIKIDRLKESSFVKLAQELCSIDVNSFDFVDGNLSSPDYRIHAQDLRKLPHTLPGVDDALPTLLLSECCLIYLSPEEADHVLTHFTRLFQKAPIATAIYEPIRPNDSFGKTMVRNLTARGIQLQTLEKYADLDQQRQRLNELQFVPRAEDIDFIWQRWVEDKEKQRVESLEWMDEVEEFVLLAKHYCISWGWRGWVDESKWKALPASHWNDPKSVQNA